jgi:hypothetical protein
MSDSTNLPVGLIPVPLNGAILLLTEQEYLAGIRRGKWWRRRVAMERRTTPERSPVVASGEHPPDAA